MNEPSENESGPTERVVAAVGEDGLERLRSLPGADFTTLLIELTRGRAEAETAASVLRRYERDRFVTPATVPFEAMRRTEDRIVAALPKATEVVTLSPLVPLAAHRAVAPVDPRWSIATVRATEVAADPTNGLALEAAVRRRALVREGRADEVVRLAASQRVVRAQRFEGPGAFAHFGIVALVTAGRDPGGHRFEHAALAEHVRFLIDAFLAVGARGVRLALTGLDDSAASLLTAARNVGAQAGVEVADQPDKARGIPYYERVRFQVYADLDESSEQIADGGFVDWAAQLTASRKERFCISGIGLERLTLASTGSGTAR